MRPLAIMLALLCACGADKQDAGGDDFVDPYMDDPLPPSCRDTTESTGCVDTTAGEEAICTATASCPSGQICAAAFDGDIGVFLCQSACIATQDEQSWCFDDAACCDDQASCVRGLCITDAP